MGLAVRKPDFVAYKKQRHIPTPGRQQSKTLIISIKVDKISLETEFVIEKHCF